VRAPIRKLLAGDGLLEVTLGDGSKVSRQIAAANVNTKAKAQTFLDNLASLIGDPSGGETVLVHLFSVNPLDYAVGVFHSDAPEDWWK
jgi:hypothetical protein